MIPNIVIPMPINASGISAENVPILIVALLVAWFLCIILGMLLTYISIRKHNKKTDNSIYNPKISYREIFNPTLEMKHDNLDNMIGSALLGAGYSGLCLMAFIAMVFWITELIIG